jgi:transcriptional regulator with XRE-family HTH domain
VRVSTAEDFGSVVRERRHELRLSQQAAADRAGVNRSWLSAVEQGHARAELGKLLRLVRALDMVLDLAPRSGVLAADLAQHLSGFDEPVTGRGQ